MKLSRIRYRMSSLMWCMLFISSGSLISQVTLEKENITCHGLEDGKCEVIVTGIDGDISYAWSHNPIFTHRTALNLAKGDYSVTVSVGGCTVVKYFKIFEPAEIGAHITRTPLERRGCDGVGRDRDRLSATPYGGTGELITSWSQGPDTNFIDVNIPSRQVCVISDENGCAGYEYWESQAISYVCSYDPNEIIGPHGFDTVRWMSIDDEFGFTVNFENDEVFATAPAQVVKVSVPLDGDFNPFSLKLLSFGFKNLNFELPGNATFYQNRLDLQAELGLFVDVVAGLNVADNEAFWTFTSIDPTTGQIPLDPLVGFLPINDTLTGSGEGFVNFSIKPKSTSVTGDIVEAQASIVFDANDGIETNIWTNTIDAVAPSSMLDPLAPEQDTNLVSLSWVAADDANASGLHSIEIYASIDSGAFHLIQIVPFDDGNSYDYFGQYGVHYDFYILAVDNTGNKEVKQTAETSTLIRPLKSIEFAPPIALVACVLDTLEIHWESTSIDFLKLEYSSDTGSTYSTIQENIPSESLPFKWAVPTALSGNSLVLKISDQADYLVQDSIKFLQIRQKPNVQAGQDQTICLGDIIFLSGSGANNYLWSPGLTLNDSTIVSPTAFPTQTTDYIIRGTDVYGCVAQDTVRVNVNPTYTITEYHTICQGDSVYAAGAWQTNEGTYEEILSTDLGCDSTILSVISYIGETWTGTTIVYVDSSAAGNNNGTDWTNAFNSLQDALCVAYTIDSVNQVWVAKGTYYPSPDTLRAISFVLQDSVKVFGGFAGGETDTSQRNATLNITRLSGDIGAKNTHPDNSMHVLRIDPASIGAVLDGFSIQDGYADGQSFLDKRAAGVLSEGEATLSHISFENHFANTEGSLIFNLGANAKLTLHNCSFKYNDASPGNDILNSTNAELKFTGINTVIKE